MMLSNISPDIYKHGSVNSADKHEEHSRPASIWVEMKCLKMKLPNHFIVYVTNKFYSILYKWEMAKGLM